MPKCIVRLPDTLETQHSVVVYAESLCEAVVRGLNQLSEVGWETHADETIKQVEVEIYQEPTKHVVDVPKLLAWIRQNAMSPRPPTHFGGRQHASCGNEGRRQIQATMKAETLRRVP